MSAPLQFSLRWNNYSQHIVTALEDLRPDDEFTDVTLSCEGQRIKGHKILLSACSSYFRDTFKENPCKHPIIILKGVSFVDLEAVVTFMYNGQVNLSQERLPTFLQTAELLQIKGLTDMNEKEEVPKKRVGGNLPINQNSKSSLSHSASRSGTPDIVQQRPPSPKRKRVALDNFTNDGASTSSGVFRSSFSNTPTQPVRGGTGSNVPTAGSSTGGGSSGLTSQSSSMVMPTVSGVTSLASTNQTDSDDPFNPNVSIKYEDDGLQDDDDYDETHNMSSEDNDNSIQDKMCNVDPGSIARSPVHVGYSTTGEPVAYGVTLLLNFNLEYFGLSHVRTSLLDTEKLGPTSGQLSYDSKAMDEGEEGDNVTRGDPIRPSLSTGTNSRLPLICDLCGKTYTCKSSYYEHKRFHQGEFKCPVCGKQLSQKTHLNRHLKNVHHSLLSLTPCK